MKEEDGSKIQLISNMKRLRLLIFLSVLLISCEKKQIYPDITFIKIGQAEITTKSDSISIGSAFFIRTNFQQDSLYIKFNIQPDDPDSFSSFGPPMTYKIKMTDEIKKACLSFIEYSKHLPNGNLPNAYFEEPPFYNGGNFLIYYRDNHEVEHYFSYVKKDLSYETQQLHNIFMKYYSKKKLINSDKVKFNINSDSISRTICAKKEMNIIDPILPKFKPHPLKK